MTHEIRTGDLRGINKGRCLKFRVSSRIHLKKAGGHIGRNIVKNNNRDEHSSPKTLNDKNLFLQIKDILQIHTVKLSNSSISNYSI